MNTFILRFIFLMFLNSTFAAVFQYDIHKKEGLGMQLRKQSRWQEYAAYKENQLYGKFSNFKSTSQNIGNFDNDYNYYNYYINITIGTPEQFFTAYLDIEGGITVIMNTNCSYCETYRRFNSSKSSTYKSTNYTALAGPRFGVFGQDVVRFGNPETDQLIIPNAMFFQGYIGGGSGTLDGSVGLGFVTDNNNGVDPPIITAVKSGILDSPVVTVFLKSVRPNSYVRNSGVITYGAVDTVNCDRNVIYETITDPTHPNMYQASIQKASLGCSEFTGNWTAYIGMYGLRAPETIVDFFVKEVNGSYDSTTYLYTVDCNVKFNLNLTIGSMVYTMTEKELVRTLIGRYCYFDIVSNVDNYWNLGISSFTSVCVVLDYDKKKLEFAKVINSNATASAAITSCVTAPGSITSGGNHSSSIHSLNLILLGILLMFIQ